ncbi:hypothetical protein O6R08_01615 [Cutibacterium equinum]|uniref:Lipoprotein n=1 Tax=Cutibacterium equinum TaxID=3016342 RepID=A0ABY7R019_9ACTN|nr:hypothetical protein [Cutibacterium equinum]WCC80270.1 hypothetical protein O6R08_01615 [Cutibacterium equinum]
MIYRLRTTAALAAVAVLGLTACGADPKVLTSYTPAAGVSGESDTVKVQNLVLINGDGQARVSAAVVSNKNDKVVGIAGQPLSPNNSLSGKPFTVTPVDVDLPARTAVNLTETDLEAPVEGLSDGLLAKVTITFANSAPITLDAPVVPSSHPDFEKYAPSQSPSAQS